MERLMHYGRLSLKDWKAVPKNLFINFLESVEIMSKLTEMDQMEVR